jgi:hypothetical protein
MSGRGADSEGDLELMRCVIDAYLEDFAKQHTQVAEVGLKTTPAVKVIQPPTLIRRSAFGF